MKKKPSEEIKIFKNAKKKEKKKYKKIGKVSLKKKILFAN